MEIIGKIIQELPLQKGIGKTSGKEWQLQAYVLETQEQYPRKVHFELFGEDRVKANKCSVDDIVKVSYDIESREFNGRWYTSIRAWRVEVVTDDDATKQDDSQNNSAGVDLLANELSATEIREQENDNLPF